jgi:hypothetical protein
VTSANGNDVNDNPMDWQKGKIVAGRELNPYNVIDGQAAEENESCPSTATKAKIGEGLMVRTVEGTFPYSPNLYVADPWIKITTSMKMLVAGFTLSDLRLSTGVDTFGFKKGRKTEGKLIVTVGNDICAELSYIWKMSQYPIGPVKCGTPIPGTEITFSAPGPKGTELELCEITLDAELLECDAAWC